jgi:hypothetical protein
VAEESKECSENDAKARASYHVLATAVTALWRQRMTAMSRTGAFPDVGSFLLYLLFIQDFPRPLLFTFSVVPAA